MNATCKGVPLFNRHKHCLVSGCVYVNFGCPQAVHRFDYEVAQTVWRELLPQFYPPATEPSLTFR